MKTNFEYTASGTQQQNSYTEMGFTALAGISRATMNKKNIPRAISYKLFGKVSNIVTKLESLVMVEVNRVKKMHVKAL